MRVPLSWLREYAPLPAETDASDVARRLTAAGLEVESVESVGHDVTGVVTGQVLTIEELTGFKKPIRYCRVADSSEMAAGDPEKAHGVICGATNFTAGDKIAFATVGAVLPGDFKITERKTYGHLSQGMICAVDELGIGDDHSGIMVLPPDTPLGLDFVEYAGLRDDVLEIAVTPDRGYAVSVRGVARELASAYGVPFTDPAGLDTCDLVPGVNDTAVVGGDLAAVSPDVYPASIADPTACDRFVLRELRGFDPHAATPVRMAVRLARAGIRTISLAVDVTNYLMLELGQPLHAFDRAKLSGPVVVRRASAGEKLETLDHVKRTLHPDDILITDASGPISMAGTMGGLHTEIDDESSDLVIEGAHFDDVGTAKMSRRHKLHSEASYRFERGVDRELPLRATARAVALLSALGGGQVIPGATHASVPVESRVITMAVDYPDTVAGVSYGRDVVVKRLSEVGCAVRETTASRVPTLAPWRSGEPATASAETAVLEVTPPSWRGDLTDPADLAEEVIRLEGYENIPVRTPRASAGRGLTARQRMIRSVSRALAGAGYTEARVEPFAPATDADNLMLAPDDERRAPVVIANPLSDGEPHLRTTLLPGLFRAAVRNIGRGFGDLALFESGLAFRPRPDAGEAPILATDRGPTGPELASLEAALPDQPTLIAGVLTGNRALPGWWGPARAAGWADAIEAARTVVSACHLAVEVRAAKTSPWHPGRCAALYAGGDRLVGHAGELHPRVIAAYGLPDRACAFELDFGALASAAEAAGPVRGPALPSYPLATQDVAVVVPDDVPAADVAAALREGAGDLLEDLRLFDVYTGSQLPEGQKSLAYSLRFRAPDRTLTAAETTAARDAAVAEAASRLGAVIRSLSPMAPEAPPPGDVKGAAQAPFTGVRKGGFAPLGRYSIAESDIAGGSAAEERAAERAGRIGFREVFALSEFRALWVAQLASVAGDQLARVALTVLVYARTGSALLSAVTFVASVIPMFIGGVTLGGLADRFPRRTVMITCDLLRCALVLLMIVPGTPVAALVVLLFLATLASAPFTAARSALVPDVLEGERYVLGQTITMTTIQFAQVIGFGAGGAVTGFLGTRPSLAADAATYALSALITVIWVRRRPSPRLGSAPGTAPGTVSGGRGPRGGFRGAARYVLGTPALLLPMLFGWLSAFYNVPEGVAAPLARTLGGGAATVGVLLAAQMLGDVIGMLIIGRLVPPAARRRGIGPLAVGTCAVLAVFAVSPPTAGALAVLVASGVFGGYQLAASAEFVAVLPAEVRGTAFGLAQGGMSLGQGLVIIAAGAAADAVSPSMVIAVTGAAGAACAVAVAIGWARLAGPAGEGTAGPGVIAFGRDQPQ